MSKLTWIVAALLILWQSCNLTHANQNFKTQCSATQPTENVIHKQDLKKNRPSQSWWAWLLGDSKSAQFHYLDLLELLFTDEGTK